MNNEIAAWIQVADDAVALKVLKHAIEERLADIESYRAAGGNPAAPQAMTAPLRRTESMHAGRQAEVMAGPNPSPFYLDQLKAEANREVIAQAQANARQASVEQQARAEEMASQKPDGQAEEKGHEIVQTQEAKGHEAAKGKVHSQEGDKQDTVQGKRR